MKLREAVYHLIDLWDMHDSLMAKSSNHDPAIIAQLRDCQEEIRKLEELEITS